MEDIYEEMMTASRDIAASFPPPRFYTSCREALESSASIYSSDGQILKCRRRILTELKEDFGHGMGHAERVALEAGALAHIEGGKISQGPLQRRFCLLAQIAGLLHDLRRGEKNHAKASAAAAAGLLTEFSLDPGEGEYILQAISNHEAFVEPARVDSPVGQMISDALYDADKFRWGPDNFTLTLWQMLRSSRAPIDRLVRRFPKGLIGIAGIKETFRTETGKTYGPEFIDLGLSIGEKIYRMLRERFAGELEPEEVR